MVRHLPTLSIAMSVTSLALFLAQPATAETVTIGIGTQDTTTNTVTAGVVIRQLKLLEKYLPKDGKYANIKFEMEWQNFTSGPPVTNAMMANKLQIGMNSESAITTGPSISTRINLTSVPICVLTSPAGRVAASTCGTA